MAFDMRLDLRSGNDRSRLRTKSFVTISNSLLVGLSGIGHLPGELLSDQLLVQTRGGAKAIYGLLF